MGTKKDNKYSLRVLQQLPKPRLMPLAKQGEHTPNERLLTPRACQLLPRIPELDDLRFSYGDLLTKKESLILELLNALEPRLRSEPSHLAQLLLEASQLLSELLLERRRRVPGGRDPRAPLPVPLTQERFALGGDVAQQVVKASTLCFALLRELFELPDLVGPPPGSPRLFPAVAGNEQEANVDD